MFYSISNSSMNIYLQNTCSTYSNRLSKHISMSNLVVNSLWLSLQSITFENAIIRYKLSLVPDIISIASNHAAGSKVSEHTTLFYFPEEYFSDDILLFKELKRKLKIYWKIFTSRINILIYVLNEMDTRHLFLLDFFVSLCSQTDL